MEALGFELVYTRTSGFLSHLETRTRDVLLPVDYGTDAECYSGATKKLLQILVCDEIRSSFVPCFGC